MQKQNKSRMLLELIALLQSSVSEETLERVVGLVVEDTGRIDPPSQTTGKGSWTPTIVHIPKPSKQYSGTTTMTKRGGRKMQRWASEEDLKLMAFYNEGHNRFKDGTLKKTEVQKLASSLGRSKGAIEQRFWSLGLRSPAAIGKRKKGKK